MRAIAFHGQPPVKELFAYWQFIVCEYIVSFKNIYIKTRPKVVKFSERETVAAVDSK